MESKNRIDCTSFLLYDGLQEVIKLAIEYMYKKDMIDISSGEEERRWQAVLSRDRASDGSFFFGVRSTRVYCRPSCPARRPRRDQVVFFTLAEAAEQAGFRACLRCRPLDAATDHQHREIIEHVCRAIDSQLEEEGPITLSDLSNRFSISPYHLQRTFKRIMGITPRQYAEARRLDRLKSRLKSEENVSKAIYDAGYGSSSRLYERADGHLGMTPTAYRNGGRQMSIGYTVADCSLGKLLVAATERGICAVSLGDSEDALRAELLREYPAAEVHRDDAGLSQWVGSILGHLQGAQPHLDLPLDVQATAFQWRVWRELQSIPYGKTYSYSQIAQALGRPTAARAVARACATNPAALVIPCHRVVKENGGLGGYRWGIDRKQRLLARERDDE